MASIDDVATRLSHATQYTKPFMRPGNFNMSDLKSIIGYACSGYLLKTSKIIQRVFIDKITMGNLNDKLVLTSCNFVLSLDAFFAMLKPQMLDGVDYLAVLDFITSELGLAPSSVSMCVPDVCLKGCTAEMRFDEYQPYFSNVSSAQLEAYANTVNGFFKEPVPIPEGISGINSLNAFNKWLSELASPIADVIQNTITESVYAPYNTIDDPYAVIVVCCAYYLSGMLNSIPPELRNIMLDMPSTEYRNGLNISGIHCTISGADFASARDIVFDSILG